jgi:hypothetical protein
MEHKSRIKIAELTFAEGWNGASVERGNEIKEVI